MIFIATSIYARTQGLTMVNQCPSSPICLTKRKDRKMETVLAAISSVKTASHSTTTTLASRNSLSGMVDYPHWMNIKCMRVIYIYIYTHVICTYIIYTYVFVYDSMFVNTIYIYIYKLYIHVRIFNKCMYVM